MPHSVVMALHEDRWREVERSMRGRKVRHSGRVQRWWKALGLSAGQAICPRPAEHPVQTSSTMIMAAATNGGCTDAVRQN
ncbi:MAG TPA: hypothetical protein VMF65_04975 [Acidimicrobiales bacterium]|nr:hypothetical protein [Acidimicrobiales bacterium]